MGRACAAMGARDREIKGEHATRREAKLQSLQDSLLAMLCTIAYAAARAGWTNCCAAAAWIRRVRARTRRRRRSASRNADYAICRVCAVSDGGMIRTPVSLAVATAAAIDAVRPQQRSAA